MRRQSMTQAGWWLVGLAFCAAAPAPGYTPPTPLHNAALSYPAGLQITEASVGLACTITATGSSQDCAITSSTDHRFDTAALSYARAALYRPALRNGVPVADPRHTLMVNFTLSEHADIMCDCAIDHTGRIGHCAAITGATSPMLPLLAHILGPMHMMPTLHDGQPVDDPHRRVRVVLEENALPLRGTLTPMPRSQANSTLFATCRMVMPVEPGVAAHRNCTVVDPSAVPALIRQRAQTAEPVAIMELRVGITGLRPDPLPDSSFGGPD